MTPPRIGALIVDDEPSTRDSLQSKIRRSSTATVDVAGLIHAVARKPADLERIASVAAAILQSPQRR